MNDNSIMPFGQYKGAKMANVPASYLLWCYDQEWIKGNQQLKEYIERNLDVLKMEVEKEIRK